MGMSIGLEKCANIHFKRRKVSEATETVEDIVDSNILKRLGESKNYSYLGIEQRYIQDVKRS